MEPVVRKISTGASLAQEAVTVMPGLAVFPAGAALPSTFVPAAAMVQPDGASESRVIRCTMGPVRFPAPSARQRRTSRGLAVPPRVTGTVAPPFPAAKLV